jgi:hypothetical protein
MTQRTITVTGADIDLFHIAAVQLLDATQWIRIAQLNGLRDPAITGLTTLIIPSLDPSQTGGVPNQ